MLNLQFCLHDVPILWVAHPLHQVVEKKPEEDSDLAMCVAAL